MICCLLGHQSLSLLLLHVTDVNSDEMVCLLKKNLSTIKFKKTVYRFLYKPLIYIVRGGGFELSATAPHAVKHLRMLKPCTGRMML